MGSFASQKMATLNGIRVNGIPVRKTIVRRPPSIMNLTLDDLRVLMADRQYPCVSMVIKDSNLELTRLYRTFRKDQESQYRKEALRIVIPFIDIELCQMGQLLSGTLIVLKLRPASYLAFQKTFDIPGEGESSPETFLQIITKQTIIPTEMKMIEQCMKFSNAKVRVAYGTKQFNCEQILKKVVDIDQVLTAPPELMVIDDVDDDEVSEGSGDNDYKNKELINIMDHVVKVRDYLTLLPRAFLNDAILDYYLHKIQETFHEKYSSMQMSFIPAFKAGVLVQKSLEKNHLNSTIEKLLTVRKIPDCDYLVLPIVQEQHWFLAVITNVKHVFKQDFSTVVNGNVGCLNVIYFDSFDSYFGQLDRAKFDSMIYEFMKDCLLAHKKLNNVQNGNGDANPGAIVQGFTKENFNFIYPLLPQQTNNFDCGLFLLEYAEKFFERPVELTKMLVKDFAALEKWFTPMKKSITRNFLMNTIRTDLSIEEEKILDDYVKARKFDSP